MKLSPTMREALSKIVAEDDAAVARELKLWGIASAAAVARKGIDTSQIVSGYKTLHALVYRGLIARTTRTMESESLRRGAYGRWIGGTTRHLSTASRVVPTALGRAIAAQEAM